MKGKFARPLFVLILLSVIATLLLGCAAPAPAPAAAPSPTAAKAAEPAKPAAEPTKAPAAATAAPKAEGGVVNRAGVKLPADAAPLDKQVMRYAETEAKWLTWDASVYDENCGRLLSPGPIPASRPDKNYEPQPNVCTKWETSKDGLTWTFNLHKDKKWSDGKPITADDWVFTLQRFARPDYDFEWFYSMANIVNWSDVVSGKKPPEELGVKKVDDYTFSVTTDSAHALPDQDLRRPVGRAQAHRQGPPERRLVGLRQEELGLRRPVQAGELRQGQGAGLCRQRQVHRPLPAHDGQDRRHLHGRPRRAGPPTRTTSWTPSAAATSTTCRPRPWPRSWPTRS